jgi:hypothetical protein
VAQRQVDAIGTDVYINNHPSGELWFNTCSRDFTLLLGKGPYAGIVRVRIWNGTGYDTLAEFNGQASSTIWRYGLNVTINPASYPPCNGTTPYRILVEVDSNTQFGNTLDYGYVDALLLNDEPPSLFGFGYTALETIDYPDAELVEVGAGWATLAQVGAIGDEIRRTAVSGNSIQFTVNDPDGFPDATDPQSPRLIFSRAPDGGIAEVFVNGVFQYEISFYSPVTLTQQFLPLMLPANTEFPAVVELRNVPRRTFGSIGYYIYVDAVIETREPTGFVAPIINNPGANPNNRQNDSPDVQLFGALWTNSLPSATMFPSGANIGTTLVNSGGVRFILTGSNRFSFVSSASANRGIAEIWVNGRLCTACGTINTYRPQTFWRVPFLVEIPVSMDADPDPGASEQLYYVQLHTTNMRSVGAIGFGLSADEIIPHNGGTIVANDASVNAWDDIVDGQLPGLGGYNGVWPTVISPFAYGGSFRRTTTPGAEYSFELNTAMTDVVILRNTGPTGGMAEIWFYDFALADELHCFECGTMNNYSPYTRYQVPFHFQVPTRFAPNPNFPGPADDFWIVYIVNTALRPAGSIGNELALDAFILLP